MPPAPLNVRAHLRSGQVIPAHPLALTPDRALDERHQRALTRYYVESGAGGMAVGVHTTGFRIHDADVGLYRPVLELASETAAAWLARDGATPRAFVKVAGLVGRTDQALREAAIARDLGYHCGLLSLGAWRDATDAEILTHCRRVAEAIPLFGFYLQPAVGGRVLSHRFWREFAEIRGVVAIKVAPFDRYATLDVVRAIAESGRDDIALYTGNDDAIVTDLVTDVPVIVGGTEVHARFVGGLLGQWAVWTRAAVELLDDVQAMHASRVGVPSRMLTYGAALTHANAAIFDVSHAFRGCLPGILEVLRRQGLVRGTWTLDPHERLSEGQADAIARVATQWPMLSDDAWVSVRREAWLRA
jgi:dihydrodipicolinate synthase/N-acetylneuraminate lyase